MLQYEGTQHVFQPWASGWLCTQQVSLVSRKQGHLGAGERLRKMFLLDLRFSGFTLTTAGEERRGGFGFHRETLLAARGVSDELRSPLENRSRVM